MFRLTAALEVVIVFSLLSSCALLNPSSDNDRDEGGDAELPVLLPYSYSDEYPALRPAHRQVAFFRRRGNKPPESFVQGLYLVDLDTRETHLLKPGSYGRPVWLDANSILVGEYSTGGGCLCLLDITTFEMTPLCDIRVQFPTVNTTDSTIVYEDSAYLWRLDLRTNSTAQLTAYHGYRVPSFSPDGSRIAVECRALNGYSTTITILAADGTRIRDVSPAISGYSGTYPSWNQAGTKLAYVRMSPSTTHTMIVLCDISGTSEIVLRKGLFPIFANSGLGIVYSDTVTSSNPAELRLFITSLEGGSADFEQLTY
jgi:Tol biopolymer transport system component